jgi:hypothetical protein
MTAVSVATTGPTKTNVFLRGLVDTSPAFPFAALTIKMSVCTDFLVPDPAFGAIHPPGRLAFTAASQRARRWIGAGRRYRELPRAARVGPSLN